MKPLILFDLTTFFCDEKLQCSTVQPQGISHPAGYRGRFHEQLYLQFAVSMMFDVQSYDGTPKSFQKELDGSTQPGSVIIYIYIYPLSPLRELDNHFFQER